MILASVFDTENTLSKCSYKSADGAQFLRVFHETGNPRELRGVSPIKRATEHAPTLSRFNSSDMPRLSREQRAEVLGRLHAGQTARQAANHFNVHVRTIYRLQQRVQATRSTSDRHRSGRPSVTSLRQDRQIVRHHLQNRFATATETARTTIGNHQRPISDDTVHRRLRQRNVRCHRPYRGHCSTSSCSSPVGHTASEFSESCLRLLMSKHANFEVIPSIIMFFTCI